jgi:hypothetical protein
LISGEKNFVHATEDFFLLPYLRACKFYPKSAFERIQAVYKLKIKYKKYSEDLTTDSIKNISEDGVFKFTPLCDKNGRRIVLIQCGSK